MTQSLIKFHCKRWSPLWPQNFQVFGCLYFSIGVSSLARNIYTSPHQIDSISEGKVDLNFNLFFHLSLLGLIWQETIIISQEEPIDRWIWDGALTTPTIIYALLEKDERPFIVVDLGRGGLGSENSLSIKQDLYCYAENMIHMYEVVFKEMPFSDFQEVFKWLELVRTQLHPNLMAFTQVFEIIVEHPPPPPPFSSLLLLLVPFL